MAACWGMGSVWDVLTRLKCHDELSWGTCTVVMMVVVVDSNCVGAVTTEPLSHAPLSRAGQSVDVLPELLGHGAVRGHLPAPDRRHPCLLRWHEGQRAAVGPGLRRRG